MGIIISSPKGTAREERVRIAFFSPELLSDMAGDDSCGHGGGGRRGRGESHPRPAPPGRPKGPEDLGFSTCTTKALGDSGLSKALLCSAVTSPLLSTYYVPGTEGHGLRGQAAHSQLRHLLQAS